MEKPRLRRDIEEWPLSAYSLAEFIMDRQGDAWLDKRISSVRHDT